MSIAVPFPGAGSDLESERQFRIIEAKRAFAVVKRQKVEDELEISLNSRSVENLFFPEDIQNMDYWMCFRINQFDLTRKEDFPTKTDLKRIFLPVPLNLGTQYGHNYNQESLGAAGIGGAKVGASEAVKGASSVADAIRGGFKEMFKQASFGGVAEVGTYYAAQNIEALGVGLGTAITGALDLPDALGAVAGAAGGKYAKGAIAGAGIAVNPYMAVMYNSPQFRTHQFSWKLIAKSKKESDAIKDIIFAFKFHAAPGTAQLSPNFFAYPQQFDIDLHYENYLFNIAPSVLTNIEVSYHGEGYPAYHDIGGGEDKAPVSITLQCTFQETSIVTKETILSENR